MRRHTLAVLALALLAAPARAQITYMPPAFGLSGSVSVGCVPKATSATGIACGLLTDDGTNVTLSSGALIFGTDNTYDIGASGANRPRNGYFGGSLMPGGDLILGAGGSYVRSSTSGVILFGNASLNDFNRLQLGGTTSSFPAIKRNGTGINIRLADDSADAPISASYFYWLSRSVLASAQDGQVTLSNNAQTDFSRLQLGGTTSSFPAIKRDGAALANVFADGTGPLTTATMTAEHPGLLATTTSSYTWTNAMVVALGASTTGDIKVATLPAKTQVIDAAVVITGTAAGTTTLTVACGRTSAAYIDYIVASDAQAAANTVYGDASAERGTNLTGYDLPSYQATTDVYCHFISTGSNLSAVTGSTGRVILTTRLLP